MVNYGIMCGTFGIICGTIPFPLICFNLQNTIFVFPRVSPRTFVFRNDSLRALGTINNSNMASDLSVLDNLNFPFLTPIPLLKLQRWQQIPFELATLWCCNIWMQDKSLLQLQMTKTEATFCAVTVTLKR